MTVTTMIISTQKKFSTGIIHFDNHNQSFWRLIGCWIQCVLG